MNKFRLCYKHDWVESTPFDPYMNDFCSKCGKQRFFNRKTLEYEKVKENFYDQIHARRTSG